MTEITMLELDLIDQNPGQPRKRFTGIEELSVSIRDHGLQQPIVVRPKDGRYEIVAGERRFMACRLLGRKTVETIIRELGDAEAYELTIIENAQRKDLSPMEEAEAFKRLQEAGYTQQRIADMVGKTQSYVAHKLRLLSLPDFLTVYLRLGVLTENHVRQIARLKGIYPPGLMREFNGEREPWELWEPKDGEDAGVLLYILRPEDHVPPFKAGPEQMESCRLFLEYVSKHNGRLPQWEVAACWWAAIASTTEVSVSDLTTAMNRWEERYRDAMAVYHSGVLEIIRKNQEDGERLYWGFRGDVKQSGSLELDLKDEAVEDWHYMNLRAFHEKGSYVLPTCYQTESTERLRTEEAKE